MNYFTLNQIEQCYVVSVSIAHYFIYLYELKPREHGVEMETIQSEDSENKAEDDDMIPDNQEFNEVVDGLAAEVVNWGNSVIWRFHMANNKFSEASTALYFLNRWVLLKPYIRSSWQSTEAKEGV